MPLDAGGGKYPSLLDPLLPFGAAYDAEDARPPVPTRLRALCRGGAMFPVVSIFRAGLYVGGGACGIAAENVVSKGNFNGRSGSTMFSEGIDRGPSGRDIVRDVLGEESM